MNMNMKTYQRKEKGQQEVKAGRMEISKGRARVNKTAVILFFSFKNHLPRAQSDRFK